jgi:hypothetical protein
MKLDACDLREVHEAIDSRLTAAVAARGKAEEALRAAAARWRGLTAEFPFDDLRRGLRDNQRDVASAMFGLRMRELVSRFMFWRRDR